MATKTALETLTELAQRDVDNAAKRLGQALKALDDAEKKLQLLQGYRNDYAIRFEAAQVQGMAPMAFQNFLAFLGKLDNAVKGQQEVVGHARRRSEQEKQNWQVCERKRLSYATLSQRAAEEALRLENKRDQKMMDEFAARRAFDRR
ncbi:flagellar export protein FliJ [Massilia sp. TS11]|uniref:flagellar export protein FliJ n=1 Tax=Massilia sp. TS11 TaxID=2908003 RepID=UPI001ED9CD45|nr:flagellar export protein FliJ [Massilia sp. TS11]MCG2582877.1 flagellar export protein FliJ [Massilia sp. TS11]